MASLEPDRRAYRRGLVLGWSLAEVFLLILFALLFAFAALAIKWNTKELNLPFPKLRAELRAAQQKIQALRRENDELRKALRNPDQFSDLFHKLSLCEQRTAIQERELAQTLPLLDWIKRNNLTPDEAKNLAANADKYQRDAQRYQNQEKYCEAQRARFGGGADYPPCWTTPDGLKPEYIFNISLTSDGIVVHDNKLADRAADENELPIGRISFNNTVSDSAFEQQTNALYKYSKARDCRFFVRVFDATKSAEKAVYKRRLQTVESHFYKLESNQPDGLAGDKSSAPGK